MSYAEYTALEILDLIDNGNISEIDILASDDEEGEETTARFPRIGESRESEES